MRLVSIKIYLSNKTTQVSRNTSVISGRSFIKILILTFYNLIPSTSPLDINITRIMLYIVFGKETDRDLLIPPKTVGQKFQKLIKH